jgi:hypothetical protein
VRRKGDFRHVNAASEEALGLFFTGDLDVDRKVRGEPLRVFVPTLDEEHVTGENLQVSLSVQKLLPYASGPTNLHDLEAMPFAQIDLRDRLVGQLASGRYGQPKKILLEVVTPANPVPEILPLQFVIGVPSAEQPRPDQGHVGDADDADGNPHDRELEHAEAVLSAAQALELTAEDDVRGGGDESEGAAEDRCIAEGHHQSGRRDHGPAGEHQYRRKENGHGCGIRHDRRENAGRDHDEEDQAPFILAAESIEQPPHQGGDSTLFKPGRKHEYGSKGNYGAVTESTQHRIGRRDGPGHGEDHWNRECGGFERYQLADEKNHGHDQRGDGDPCM